MNEIKSMGDFYEELMINETNSFALHQNDCEIVTGDDQWVASTWSLIAAFGIVTNLLIFVGILHNRKMRHSTSYWLILSLSICDIAMLVVSLVLLVPGIALHEDYITLDSYANAFGLFIYDSFWYTGVLHLAVMAINRYVNICQAKWYSLLFSPDKTVLQIVVLYVMGLSIAVPGLFPCCLLAFDHCRYVATVEIQK